MKNKQMPSPENKTILFQPIQPDNHFVLGELRSDNEGLDGKRILLSPFIDPLFFRHRAKFLGVVNAENGDNPEDDPAYVFYSHEFGMKDLRNITGAVVEDVRKVLEWEATHAGPLRKWLTKKGFGILFEPIDMPQGKIHKPGKCSMELGGLEEIRLRYGGHVRKLLHHFEYL